MRRRSARFATVAMIVGALHLAAADHVPHDGGFMLAGEPIQFDADLHPRFSERQVRETSSATREGFTRWAATADGRSIIRRFREPGREVRVIESSDERGLGRAPQPGFATLLAAGDSSIVKRYDVILNPALADEYHGSRTPDLGLPRTPSEAMAVAWAAEMLHVDFYADGVQLPHHGRNDFQQRWRAVAVALGFPRVDHGSVDEH